MNYELRIKNKKNTGFTLIELIVAMAVFSLAIVGAVGIFIRAIEGQRKIAAIQAVEENARFVLEMLAKEVRMSAVNSPNGANDSLDIIARKEAGDEPVVYSLANGQIIRNGEAITSSQVKVSRLKFYINKSAGAPTLVSLAITIENQSQKTEKKAEMNLATTLSDRVY